MIIYLFLALALLLGIYLAVRHVKKTTAVDTFPTTGDDHSISQPPAVVEETLEGREERLNNLKNPDIEKPFAKMSVPTLVETSGIDSTEEQPQEVTTVDEIISSVAKAARVPRAPKLNPGEQDTSNVSEPAPKKNRRKKKPSKPKTDENNPK